MVVGVTIYELWLVPWFAKRGRPITTLRRIGGPQAVVVMLGRSSGRLQFSRIVGLEAASASCTGCAYSLVYPLAPQVLAT